MLGWVIVSESWGRRRALGWCCVTLGQPCEEKTDLLPSGECASKS